MTDYPVVHELGRIDVVEREDVAALSRDVPGDLATVQAVWPDFEAAFDSLQGRTMMGLVYDEVYRLSSVRVDRDDDNALSLDETVIPGGTYLRLRLRGTAPEIYGTIGAAFDELFARADHDASRPHIEHYRREGEVDCLMPVRSSTRELAADG